ncbi:MAG: hypothetical protein MI974_25950 [Chitinophagales bacterium]|nr:hypothetical protein [Chitinophagales bacterium]
MKTQLVVLAFVIISVGIGCKKENACAHEEHIFNISSQTKEWLPDEILTEEIKFQSENGDIITFQKDTTFHREYDWSFSTPCGNGNKRETIFYERIGHSYSLGDTVEILMSTNIVNTECGWGNVNEVKLMEEVWVAVLKQRQNSPKLVDIGGLSIRTKLINAEESEELCTKHYAKFNPVIELNGVNYQNVYSDDRPGHENTEFPLAEIYFQKGEGIIGYIDEAGIKWRKIE